MKFKYLILVVFLMFLVACKANEEKTVMNVESSVEQIDVFSGKYRMVFAGVDTTEEKDVIKEYLYVKKEEEKWFLANDFNDETVEMALLTDIELKALEEGFVSANNLECLKTAASVFCSVDKNAKIKEGSLALKTGYFLMILNTEQSENNVSGLVELEKQ